MSNESKGLHCPQCNFKIKFSLEELLMSGRITCPNCHLQMDMNVPTELKTHFQEMQRVQDTVIQARDSGDMPTSSNPNASFGELNLDGVKLIPVLKE